MNSSPERGGFAKQSELKQVAEGKKTAEQAQDMIDLFNSWQDRAKEQEADPEWQKNNLEYDLRSNSWICDKAKAREEYAQNIYAALCNTEWQRNDVWPRLKNQTYSCSWRYAGGIVADMCEQGDYIDWYCSGIRGAGLSEKDRASMSAEQIARCEWMDEHFVSEGHVTDEIREDFFRLGWILIESEDQ